MTIPRLFALLVTLIAGSVFCDPADAQQYAGGGAGQSGAVRMPGDSTGDAALQGGQAARARTDTRRFCVDAAFQQGIGCCAGHEGFIDEALAASRRAIELDPENAAYVSDLGWTLMLGERYSARLIAGLARQRGYR